MAPGTDLLMVARRQYPKRPHHQHTERPRSVGLSSFGIGHGAAQYWARTHDLIGAPFQRTRRTTVTREGRPLQHAQGTHESIYVLPDEHVQRVFVSGAQEALEQARAVVFAATSPTLRTPATNRS